MYNGTMERAVSNVHLVINNKYTKNANPEATIKVEQRKPPEQKSVAAVLCIYW